MADAITIQELIDARTDAKTLEEAVNGDAVTTVLSRLGETYPTLSNALNQIDSKLDSADAQIKLGITNLFENGGLPAEPFATKALMEASALIDGKYAMVTDDTVNNGLYIKTAGVWVKSAYDPVERVNDYIRNELVIDLPNEFTNGDFKDSTTGWTLGGSTATVGSEGLEIVSDGGSFSVSIRQTASLSLNVGDTYLFRTRVKLNNNECQQLGIGSTSGFEGGYTYVSDPKGGEWLYISKTLKAADSSVRFFLTQRYADAETALNKGMIVEYMSLINLSTSGLLSRYDDKSIAGLLSTKKADTSLTVQDMIDSNNRLINETDTKLEDFMAIESEVPEPIIAGYEDAYYQGNLVHGYVPISGIVDTSSPSTKFTGYLDVSNYFQIELKNFTLANHSYAFYNEDYEVVKSYPANAEGHKVNGIIPVPRDAKYFARSLHGSGKEDAYNVNILGYFDKNNISALSFKHDKLTVAEADKFEYIEDILFTSTMALQGEFVDGAVVNVGSEYSNTGYIDVLNYDSVVLAGIVDYSLDKYWLDEEYNIVSKESFDVDSTKTSLNGRLKKPKGAKYFRMNLKNPLGSNESAYIAGRRGLSTEDFQRKGSSGDSAQGWETSTESLTTSKSVEITNEMYPDIKPLKIIHYGKALGVDYGNYIDFSTEIYRLAWGMQIGMNVHKPNYPQDIMPVKNLKSANGLIFELGIEGFSFHVSPSGMDWGKGGYGMFKLGGYSPRSQTNYKFKQACIAQFTAPIWMERYDSTGSMNSGMGWMQNTAGRVIDDTIPTRVNLRQSSNFASPENFVCGYSDLQKSVWNNFARARGATGDPQAVQNGDSIHRQVYSVATGQDGDKNPILKEVAMIEVLYKEDDSNYEAEFVFKLKNKNTGEWDDVAKH